MKHRGLVGLVTTLAAGLLVGCSNSGSGSSDTTKDVTLSFASWDPDQAKGLKKIIAKFEDDNPHIKVKMETTPWDQYWTKMEAATTGGNMPDIVTMHSNESYKYMSNGMLQPLEDMAKKGDFDFDNYSKDVAQLYTYKNKHYAIPKDVTTIGVWYNKTLFKQAGVPEPDGSWTWAEFEATAKKLTDPAKGVYGFAVTSDPETGYYNWIYQNGGKIFDMTEKKSHFNDPKTVEALQFYADLALKDKVSPNAEVLQETDQMSLLQSGKVAMITHGNWMASAMAANSYTAKNIDVAALPKGKKQATVTNGLAWAMSSKTKHPKEAEKFLKFLASKQANQMQSDLGISIPAYNGLGQGWVDKFKGTFANVDAFVDGLDYGVLRPFSANTIKSETLANTEVGKLISGKETATKAADTVAKGIDETLANQ
ncbi:ABC transporter substrate-binding protein [Lacticaseibacillus absianus]|uniref:ABC transporter substrate-binding protein n=1 Tax=Lacticaseibacillus absianus TaxID=2729623 RepID=UPI0015CA93FC|nr:sugar ABC transporter substrate-binding protein [Lacticaseibacillus absianus]